MQKLIDAIFFDMDGTLTDLSIRWLKPVDDALSQIKPDYNKNAIGENITEIITQVGGKNNLLIVKVLWSIGRFAGLSRFQTIKFLYVINKDKYKMKQIQLIPGVNGLINELSREYKLALITTASRGTLEEAKRLHKIFSKFDTIITRDDVKNVKPNPESLIKACKQLKVKSENVLMIGDFPIDIIAGKKIGAKTIAVLGPLGKYTKELIELERPNYIINDIIDVLGIVKSIEN